MKCENEYTVAEAAKLIGICDQAIRERMIRGKLPIGIVIRNDSSRAKPYTYHIYKEWLHRYLEGNPVTIPEGMSDIDPERGQAYGK